MLFVFIKKVFANLGKIQWVILKKKVKKKKKSFSLTWNPFFFLNSISSWGRTLIPSSGSAKSRRKPLVKQKALTWSRVEFFFRGGFPFFLVFTCGFWMENLVSCWDAVVYCTPAPCPRSRFCVMTFSGHLWIGVKREWKFRETADLLQLLQADSPHWQAPTAGMQAASELSALGFQLLSRDVSNSESSQVVSPAGFGQRCPSRESTETSFSLGRLLLTWKVWFAC